MKRTIFAAAVTAFALSTSFASAALLTGYNFEGVTTTNTGVSPVPSAGSLAADVGTGTFSAVHASAATVWSNTAGNGTAKSISANTWSVGDYYQFTADTTGLTTGVSVRFDVTGSNTGPRDFKLQYSTDGSTFIDFTNYSIVNTAFSAGTTVTTTPPRFLFDLSSISALNNNPNAAFRVVDTSTTAINGTTVAAGGTSRIDTILVGNVPEPTALGVLAGGLAIVARRRKA